MSITSAKTYDDLLELVEGLDDDSDREADLVEDYLRDVIDALRELEATDAMATDALEQAQDWLYDERIDQDEFDNIEAYVDTIRDRLSDTRQAILDAIK